MVKDISKTAHFLLDDGTTIAYQEAGSGPDKLLLVHGLASSSLAWQQNMSGLARHYHVIAIDLPGYGASEHGEYRISMVFYATIVRQLIEQLDARQLVLVGHSMGGQIVLTTLLHFDSAC